MLLIFSATIFTNSASYNIRRATHFWLTVRLFMLETRLGNCSAMLLLLFLSRFVWFLLRASMVSLVSQVLSIKSAKWKRDYYRNNMANESLNDIDKLELNRSHRYFMSSDGNYD